MFSVLKKKATVPELAAGLLSLVQDSQSSTSDLFEALPEDAEVDREQFLDELLYLRMFAVRYGALASASAGDAEQRMHVIEAYDEHLYKLAHQSALRNQLAEVIRQRFATYAEAYAEAAKTQHHMGPPWNVAKAFAKLCGDESDIALIMVGDVQFVGKAKAASEFLKSFRIVRA